MAKSPEVEPSSPKTGSGEKSQATGALAWHVHKFGGTSVGDATCFRRVCDIIQKAGRNGIRLAVVVSAMGGKPKTTDLLIHLTKHAAADAWSSVEEVLTKIREKHQTCVQELFGKDSQTSSHLMAVIENDLSEIISLLRAVQVMREAHPSIVGIVSGYGEQWSTQILRELLQTRSQDWSYLDARRVLRVEGGGTSDVAVCWDESSKQLQQILDKCSQQLVITGFIASSRGGGSTTLGRDGSDFSASVFGRLLHADEITIWTDVSGVLSADPRKVPDAYALSEVSYKEAAELAYFGAKVVHPKTMLPAMKRAGWFEGADSIPIFIRNTFAPEDQGTRIFESGPGTWERPATAAGFTTMDDMALISIEGLGMQGVPGVASRLFSALHSAGVSTVMIAQASSEQSISFLVLGRDAQRARQATEEAFAREITVVGAIESVDVVCPVSVVAAVGDAMPQTAGVSGSFFKALGRAGVNVLAIAQGQNQRNISAVVEAADSGKAVQVLHAAFLAIVPIAIGVIGGGKIAEELLKNIGKRSDELATSMGVDLRVVAVGDPKDRTGCSWQGHSDRRGRFALSHIGKKLDPLEVLDQLAEPKEGDDLVDVMLKRLDGSRVVHKVLFDCSDSKLAAARYGDFVKSGINVVTQNYVGYTEANQVAMRQKFSSFLQSVEILKHLTAEEREQIVDVLQMRSFEQGDRIIKQGDDGTEFFMLMQGSACASCGGQSIEEYIPGQYFGELALLRLEPRAADVFASSPRTVVAVLSAGDFNRLLGNLNELMAERAKNYTKVEAGISDDVPSAQEKQTRLLGGGPRVYCGAAVGRGLPILSTLETLREGGDEVIRVDGVFSLSLHYVVTKVSPVDGSTPMSLEEAIADGKQKGVFEEDVTADLNGDHARLQLSILASELLNQGASHTSPHIEVEPLTDEAIAKGLKENPDMVLRYVGEIDAVTMRGSLKLMPLPKIHPFAQLAAGSRMTRFFTERRGEKSPVAVSGPVDGHLVVDALLADCLFLSKRLGAKRAQYTGIGHEQDPEVQRLIKTRRLQSNAVCAMRPRPPASPTVKPAPDPVQIK